MKTSAHLLHSEPPARSFPAPSAVSQSSPKRSVALMSSTVSPADARSPPAGVTAGSLPKSRPVRSRCAMLSRMESCVSSSSSKEACALRAPESGLYEASSEAVRCRFPSVSDPPLPIARCARLLSRSLSASENRELDAWRRIISSEVCKVRSCPDDRFDLRKIGCKIHNAKASPPTETVSAAQFGCALVPCTYPPYSKGLTADKPKIAPF